MRSLTLNVNERITPIFSDTSPMIGRNSIGLILPKRYCSSFVLTRWTETVLEYQASFISICLILVVYYSFVALKDPTSALALMTRKSDTESMVNAIRFAFYD